MDVRRLVRSGRAVFGALRRGFLVPAADFLYPPVCMLCNDPVDGSGAAVCARCWGLFPPVDQGHPVWRELRKKVRGGGAIDDIIACWLLEPIGPVKEAVHLLKYRKIRSLGVRMGEELGRKIASDPLFAAADLLVPVPLHRTRYRERGYNQSDLLCEGIARVSGLHLARDLLRRTRYTESQTLFDLGDRRTNIDGAFVLDPVRVGECAGKTVILVDDVMTTGTTLLACAGLLKMGGSVSVLAACPALAR